MITASRQRPEISCATKYPGIFPSEVEADLRNRALAA
jgi:hypothetical protein